MKILLSNKFFYPRGGDCIHTILLKHLLEQYGHEVAVFSMQYPENIKNEYAKYWPTGIAFDGKNPIRLIKALRRPFGEREVKSKWQKLLKDFQPDIVHLHNIHSQLSPIIAQEATAQNIPVYWTLHDYKLICPAYTFIDASGNVCEACLQDPRSVLQKKCIKGSKLASTIGYYEARKWSKERLEHYTSRFIAPSAFLKSKMVKAGFPEQRVNHIYNFADDAKFDNEVVLERKNEIVYVGRLSKEKGVGTLCNAFNSMSDVDLTIIGDGPLRTMLENQYASDKITFMGFQKWEVVKEKLGQATFMVIPSEWYENNPLIIIEALSLGTPVLGAAIGGIPELIEKNVNGLIFKAGNNEDLHTKLLTMLEYDSWDYQKIQDKAKEKFSQVTYYQKLIELYQSI